MAKTKASVKAKGRRRRRRGAGEETERSVQEVTRSLRSQLKMRGVTSGHLFKLMDGIHGNDKVTLNEFSRGIAACGVRPVPSDEELRMLFHSWDVDKNHTVDFNEVAAALMGELD